VLQPIIVRPLAAGGFELVAGEPGTIALDESFAGVGDAAGCGFGGFGVERARAGQRVVVGVRPASCGVS